MLLVMVGRLRPKPMLRVNATRGFAFAAMLQSIATAVACGKVEDEAGRFRGTLDAPLDDGPVDGETTVWDGVAGMVFTAPQPPTAVQLAVPSSSPSPGPRITVWACA